MRFRIECQNCLMLWFVTDTYAVRRHIERHMETDGHKHFDIRVE